MGLAGVVSLNKRLAIAALLIIAFAAFALTHPSLTPAGPDALIVNSTANTSDGVCDATTCTLREAIDDVNSGLGSLLSFDPAVFPPGAPGVIDIEGGDGPLPAITEDTTINALGSGVIIDGNSNNDGTAVGPGLTVTGSHDGFVFDLFGEGAFTIRDVAGAGIDIDGQSFVLEAVTIDAVTITDTGNQGVSIHGAPFAASISLTNSTIQSGNTGIAAVLAGPDIQDVDVFVSDNRIDAANITGAPGAAVSINMQAGLAPNSTVDIAIDDNEYLRSDGDTAVNLTYCSAATPCALDNSQINASVARNGELRADGDAVRVRFNADPPATDSIDSSIFLQIDDNDEVTATSDGLDIVSRICCGSNNSQIITIDGNGPISTLPAGSDAVDVEAGACCAPGSGVTFDLSDNTGGISAAEGEAVQLLLVCCGDNSVGIHDNATLSSGNDNGIHILSCIEDVGDIQNDELDCIADSTTLLNITGNTLSGSVEDGIHICCGEFQSGNERSVISGNTVTNNGRDGIEIDSSHGITIGPNNVVTGNGTSPDPDDNAIVISNAIAIVMFNLHGVDVPADGNTITQNEIHGNDSLGIDLAGNAEYAVVGCAPFVPAPIDPNDCLAFPILSGMTSDAVMGESCPGCLVEVFLADDQPPDQTGPSGQHGEGANYLASGPADGAGGFSIDLSCGLATGKLTATASDTNGNTSEFAANIPFGGTSGIDCTPTATPNTPPLPTPTMPFTPVPSQTQAATTTPTRTATPTVTRTPTTVPIICGDVNGDGAVNSIDAAFVLQYSAGLIDTLIAPAGADTNGDGSIDSIDAALILQNTAGLLPTLTC